jgi:predicted enzyme related to lactoylglutathione lyase
MTPSLKTVLYPVRNLGAAKATFTALTGTAPHVDQPYYVGFQVDGTELGLVPNGRESGMAGPVPYWHVDDIRARMDSLTNAGARVVQDVKNVGGTRQIAVLEDGDGNAIGLLQN